MAKYETLYSISPDLFMTQLEEDILELRARQTRFDEFVADMKSLADLLLDKKVYSISNNGRRIDKWYYDARFPNYVLSNIYDLEREESGRSKRWVGPNRFLELSLLLDRACQYELEIDVVNFQNTDMEDQFVLTIDYEEIPWLSNEERKYSAIIPEDLRPRIDDLTRIGIGLRDVVPEPEQAAGDMRTLWFAISSIAMKAR
jgi:hypothetical protein